MFPNGQRNLHPGNQRNAQNLENELQNGGGSQNFQARFREKQNLQNENGLRGSSQKPRQVRNPEKE